MADRNMTLTKGRLRQGLSALLVVYLLFTFYLTVVSRATSGIDNIRTEWLEGYKSIHDVWNTETQRHKVVLWRLLRVSQRESEEGRGR